MRSACVLNSLKSSVSKKVFTIKPEIRNSESFSASRRITKKQKSYHFTIIVLGIWLLFVSIPYHAFMAYRWASICGLLPDYTDPESNTKSQVTVKAQIITTVFFNSNHFINILIYIIFHRDFRAKCLNLFISLFNLNPVIRLNTFYFNPSKKKSEIDCIKISSINLASSNVNTSRYIMKNNAKVIKKVLGRSSSCSDELKYNHITARKLLSIKIIANNNNNNNNNNKRIIINEKFESNFSRLALDDQLIIQNYRNKALKRMLSDPVTLLEPTSMFIINKDFFVIKKLMT